MAKVEYCNKCGKSLDTWDIQEDYSMRRRLGYGSKYDGDELKINICCDCMDRFIESCVIPPVESLANDELSELKFSRKAE